VERLFDKERVGSLGAVLSARLEGAVAPNTGLLDARTKALNDRLKGLLSDRDRLDVRIARIEDNYRRQFTALDGLVSQLQSTSSFLTQELARLPGAG
jgi:flagellar hook-associated protein 2